MARATPLDHGTGSAEAGEACQRTSHSPQPLGGGGGGGGGGLVKLAGGKLGCGKRGNRSQNHCRWAETLSRTSVRPPSSCAEARLSTGL